MIHLVRQAVQRFVACPVCLDNAPVNSRGASREDSPPMFAPHFNLLTKDVHSYCKGSGVEVAFIPALYSAITLITDGDGNYLSVSRKTDAADLALPGGKVESPRDVTPWDTAVRETEEETAVTAIRGELVFHRVCTDRPALCYRVDEWAGKPRSVEAGVVRWVRPAAFLVPTCSFRDYNARLFKAVGIAV